MEMLRINIMTIRGMKIVAMCIQYVHNVYDNIYKFSKMKFSCGDATYMSEEFRILV